MTINPHILKGNATNTFVQLFRYTWVGGISFIIDYLTLYILTECLALNYLLSAAVAFILGLTTNYVLSTLWVFSDNRFKNKYSEFILFAIIGTIGLGLNEFIIYLCCEYFNIYYMISKLISTLIVFFWNFFVRKYILFTKPQNED
jgi:putative flippase GtrA